MREGQRVSVLRSYHWAKGASGALKSAPDAVREDDENWPNAYSRNVPTADGAKLFYWVSFDSPQLDAEGDGPYGEGEIDASFLELL